MAVENLGNSKGKVSFGDDTPEAGLAVEGIEVEPIGNLDNFLKIYVTTKQVQRLIDFKTNYVVKDSFFISSRDEEAKAKAEEFFDNLPILDILRAWQKQSLLYGNGFLEYTGDNIVPRDSRKMRTFIDVEGAGEVVGFVQEIGQNPEQYPVFEPEDLIVLLNNPIDHLRGTSDLLGIEDIVNLDATAMEDISATLNNAAYNRTIWKVGTPERPVSIDSEAFQNTKDLIEGLLPGEDLVINTDVSAEPIAYPRIGTDYKSYMDLINERMCMFLGIPFDFFFGSISGETISERRKLFEEAEIIPRRKQIENLINREIIPRVVSVNPEEPVEFKFGDINTEMAFIETKRDLVRLQTGAITPDEKRIEEGRDPIGEQAPEGNPAQVPISSRDETSEGTIGGNLTGERRTQDDEDN